MTQLAEAFFVTVAVFVIGAVVLLGWLPVAMIFGMTPGSDAVTVLAFSWIVFWTIFAFVYAAS